MTQTLRYHLLNPAVLIVFAVPSVGYLAVLSQYVVGRPAGMLVWVLHTLALLAIPMLRLYSAFLDAIGGVDQAVGTVGFFVFVYAVAVVVVLSIRGSVRTLRTFRPRNEDR